MSFDTITPKGEIVYMNGADTHADGYYDEPELNNSELDLSFLDEDETSN